MTIAETSDMGELVAVDVTRSGKPVWMTGDEWVRRTAGNRRGGFQWGQWRFCEQCGKRTLHWPRGVR